MNNTLSWLAWWEHADGMVKAIFLLLLWMSVVGWTILLHKWSRFQKLMQQERALRLRLERKEAFDARQGMLTGAVVEVSAWLRAQEAWLPQLVRERRVELESGLTVLASIGVSTPFIGLLGTVWGIMHALAGLGHGSALSLDLVAGPVAEALVATAAGLFAAIPAAVGYNLLIRRLRRLMTLAEGNLWRMLAQADARGAHGRMEA